MMQKLQKSKGYATVMFESDLVLASVFFSTIINFTSFFFISNKCFCSIYCFSFLSLANFSVWHKQGGVK